MNKLLALPLIAALAGCSSIGYDDPGKVETLTIDFGSTDLQSLAGEMVEMGLEKNGIPLSVVRGQSAQGP